MRSNPTARLVQSKTGEASVFGEAVQHMLATGMPITTALYTLADHGPEDMAEATAIARDMAHESRSL